MYFLRANFNKKNKIRTLRRKRHKKKKKKREDQKQKKKQKIQKKKREFAEDEELHWTQTGNLIQERDRLFPPPLRLLRLILLAVSFLPFAPDLIFLTPPSPSTIRGKDNSSLRKDGIHRFSSPGARFPPWFSRC
jgi:hypothetical protein